MFLYDFDLYKTQKHKKALGKTVSKILAWPLSAVWYARIKCSRASFSSFLKLLQISKKKLLGIYFRTAALLEKLDLFQSPYIEYLKLISSFTWQDIHKHSHWELHLKKFFLKIVIDTKYFSKIPLKRDICERVEYYY